MDGILIRWSCSQIFKLFHSFKLFICMFPFCPVFWSRDMTIYLVFLSLLMLWFAVYKQRLFALSPFCVNETRVIAELTVKTSHTITRITSVDEEFPKRGVFNRFLRLHRAKSLRKWKAIIPHFRRSHTWSTNLPPWKFYSSDRVPFSPTLLFLIEAIVHYF